MPNQQFRDAIHILLALAFAGKRMDSRQLAGSVQTNPVVIRRLLQSLRRSGLISVRLGRSGGASLRRNPARISLLDVYDAVQFPTTIARCQRKAVRQCPISRSMKEIMNDVASHAENALRQSLRRRKLSGLLRQLGDQSRQSRSSKMTPKKQRLSR